MENFGQEFRNMEGTIAQTLKTNLKGSELLKMECEEIIVALFTSYSKKSYMRLDAGDYFVDGQKISFRDHYPETMRQLTVDGKINMERLKQAQKEDKIKPIKIKGVQWSVFSEAMRDEIREMFTEILLDGDIEKIKAVYKQKLFAEFQIALEKATEGDLTHIEKFATRLRRSGKSGKCKHIQNLYPHLTDNYIYTLPMKRITKQQKMSELILPIKALNKSNYRSIDQLAIFDPFESQCKKFFSKESKTKAQRKEIIERIEEDEIMVRVETATNKQYSHFCGTPDFVEQTVKDTYGKYCLHEVIHGDKCKLFFDIDKQ